MGKVDPEIVRAKWRREIEEDLHRPIAAALLELRKLSLKGNAASATALLAYFGALTTSGSTRVPLQVLVALAAGFLLGLAMAAAAHFVEVEYEETRKNRRMAEYEHQDAIMIATREKRLRNLIAALGVTSFVHLVIGVLITMGLLFWVASQPA